MPFPRTVRTPRLSLRALGPGDLEVLYRLHSDPRLYVHQPYAALTDRDGAMRLLRAWLGHWEESGYGYWVAEDRTTGEVVGMAGVRPDDGYHNLGYRFVVEVQGRGLATEAARAAVAAAVQWLPLQPVRAIAKERNAASVRTALACGLTRAGTMTFAGDPPEEVPSTVLESPAVELPVDDPDGWSVVLRAPDGQVVGRATSGGDGEPLLLVPPAHVGRHLEDLLLAALRRSRS